MGQVPGWVLTQVPEVVPLALGLTKPQRGWWKAPLGKKEINSSRRSRRRMDGRVAEAYSLSKSTLSRTMRSSRFRWTIPHSLNPMNLAPKEPINYNPAPRVAAQILLYSVITGSQLWLIRRLLVEISCENKILILRKLTPREYYIKSRPKHN